MRRIKARHAGTPIDQEGVTVNVTITGVPFGGPTRTMHSSRGPVMGRGPGLGDGASFHITVDYGVARELIADRTVNVFEQALMAGQLTIDGDRPAFRDWWRSRIANPDAVAIDDESRAATSSTVPRHGPAAVGVNHPAKSGRCGGSFCGGR